MVAAIYLFHCKQPWYIFAGPRFVPLNFICSIRKNDIKIREQFLNAFNIITLNIFEERVFNDTSYTVCSILFKKKTNDDVLINCYIYPLKKNIKFKLNKSNNYTIGGEIYNLPKSKIYKITRATKNTDNTCITNIVLKCIDNNIHNKICLKFVNDEDIFIDNTEKSSARRYATLIIKPKIDFDSLLLDKCRNVKNTLYSRYHI